MRIYCVIILIFLALRLDISSNSYKFDNLIPNEETAKKIALIVWEPLFKNSSYKKYPLSVKLENNKYWIVEGTLPHNMDGGVPYIKISKSDCKIIEIYHTK